MDRWTLHRCRIVSPVVSLPPPPAARTSSSSVFMNLSRLVGSRDRMYSSEIRRRCLSDREARTWRVRASAITPCWTLFQALDLVAEGLLHNDLLLDECELGDRMMCDWTSFSRLRIARLNFFDCVRNAEAPFHMCTILPALQCSRVHEGRGSATARRAQHTYVATLCRSNSSISASCASLFTCSRKSDVAATSPARSISNSLATSKYGS